MIKHKFNRRNYDSCVYFKSLNTGEQIYLLLYVDDMLIACKNMEEIDKLKGLLRTEFEMKDLGQARRILGMEIDRKQGTGELTVTQKGYIGRILDRFNMKDAKQVNIPIASHFKLSTEDCPQTSQELQEMEKVPYASVVGSLMYVMVCSRPDLAYAVNLVSRFMGSPGKQHWMTVK